jgi:hypothetical protein
VSRKRDKQTVDDVVGAEGPSGVVDQDDAIADCRKPGADAVGTLAATNDQETNLTAYKRCLCQLILSATDHHPHGVDPWV